MIEIKKIGERNLEEILPIFAKYQEFYLKKPNKEENRKFLEEILRKEKEAIFHIAYFDQKAVGFSGIYFSYSSVNAQKIAIINDLFILEEFRGHGFGKELMRKSVKYLQKAEIRQIRWCTEDSNLEAQKFYEEFDAKKSGWVHYDTKIHL